MIELVSIHIPKTAGRSFLSILKQVYGENSVAHFDRKNYSDKSIPEVQQFKSRIADKIKVIHGHFQYNEIKDYNNINKAKFVSWLRDPVERVISNYSFFIKRMGETSPDNEMHKRKNESLIQYAALENSRNRMSKFLDGLPLKKFYFIGIAESFDRDVGILSEMLHWKSFDVPRINDNSEFKSQLPEVTSHERRMIEQLNGSDMELYRNVLESRNKMIS